MHYALTDNPGIIEVSGEYDLSLPKGELDPDRAATVTLNYQFDIVMPDGMDEAQEDAFVGNATRLRLGKIKERFLADPKRLSRYAEKIVYGPYPQPEKPV